MFRDPLVNDLSLWAAMLRRRWLTFVATFSIVVASAVIAAAWWPWRYESVAKFLVRNARQELVVDPNDKVQGAFRDTVPEEALNSEIELIRSRDILDRVVTKTGLDTMSREADPRVAREHAIAALGERLGVSAIRRTNLIRVSYQAGDPSLAAQVLRTLAEEYLALHLAVHSSPGTYQFFQEQTVRWKAELERSEKEIAALAATRNLIAPLDQRKETLESAAATEIDLVAVEAQIREQTTRGLAAQRALLAVQPRVTTEKRQLPNQGSVERAHTMIAELRNKRTELLTKFNPDDRLVKEVEEQLANTEAALRNATVMTATEEATDINPSWQKLQAERIDANLQLAGLRSRAERLRAQVGAYRSRAVTLAEATPGYETLLRRVADAREQYALYVRRAEEARLADALDRQKISNVVLAEAPVAALRSQRPPLMVVLLLGGVAGTMIGLVVALATDWFARPLEGYGALRPAFANSRARRADSEA